MFDLLFGTTNPGKLRELERLVAGLPLRVIAPAALGRPLPKVEEDGETFQENAVKKALAYARFSGMVALADDSGLCVDALGGAPGVRSARWSVEDGRGEDLPRAERDEANNDKLLAALAGRSGDQRGAGYVAVLAVASPEGVLLTHVEGACRGRIGEVRLGQEGFGYDPLFLPEAIPEKRTMAQLSPVEKDALSHRGAAFRALRPFLVQLAFDKSGQGG